ncbi:hypothetical protein [Candidatus Mesenet endosymbiont of Phosphuga atrata]|uniref:hypothetical protein n=1 Tax=Candidatus Mesenet endosymbiont of Phosphuga atrata TaxID=3066221 RepID=UPI0030D16935
MAAEIKKDTKSHFISTILNMEGNCGTNKLKDFLKKTLECIELFYRLNNSSFAQEMDRKEFCEQFESELHLNKRESHRQIEKITQEGVEMPDEDKKKVSKILLIRKDPYQTVK